MNTRWKIAQAAEIRWWKRYLSGKPTVEYLDWKRNYWLNLLQQTAVELQPGTSVLDVGCGPAGLYMVLNRQEVDAVDPLLDRYEGELPHFRKKQYPHVRFFSQPFEQFDQQKQYDTVFCLNAINHVADLGLCVDRLVGYTRPGGQLVVSVDAHNWRFFKWLFGHVPGDVLHPHQHSLEEYQRFFVNRGVSVQQCVCVKREMLFSYYVLVFGK